MRLQQKKLFFISQKRTMDATDHVQGVTRKIQAIFGNVYSLVPHNKPKNIHFSRSGKCRNCFLEPEHIVVSLCGEISLFRTLFLFFSSLFHLWRTTGVLPLFFPYICI